MRNITISCNYSNDILQVPKCDIWVDGKVVTKIRVGHKITLSLDENYHTVQCGFKVFDEKKLGLFRDTVPEKYKEQYKFSNKMEVLSGNKEYNFWLKKEDSKLKRFLYGYGIELVEDTNV